MKCLPRDKVARQANHLLIFSIRVKPRNKKYFSFTEMESALYPCHPVPLRGALAIVTTRDGLRWTLKLRLTIARQAYGKSVWSWRPESGVKFLRGSRFSGATVAIEHRLTGESA